MSISTSSVTQARSRRPLTPPAHTPEHAHDTAGAALAVLACVSAVLAAWAMGATWLGATVLGVPLGIWFAAIGAPVFVAVVKHRHRVVPVERVRAFRNIILPSVWPTDAPTAFIWNALADRAEPVASFLKDRGLESAATRWLLRLPWPTRSVTIGLCLPDAIAEAIIETPCSASRRVDWVRLDSESGEARETETPHSSRQVWLDAVVRYDDGRLTVECPERFGHDAAWYDWARPRPLTLASVFPFRYDPARITIDLDSTSSDTRTEDTRVLRDLIEAAAVLSRTPDRLSIADLIAGRRPLKPILGWNIDTDHTSNGLGATQPAMIATRQHESEIIRALGEALRRSHGRDRGIHRIAARVVSAWSVHEPGVQSVINDEERIRLASLAAGALRHEPEPELRVGALRLATGDDDNAFTSLLDAERVLRDRYIAEHDEDDGASPEARAASDQAALVQAYIEHGSDDDLTLGRVAAGIVLLAAGTDTERLAFMRDDLIDEFRYAGWLVGRDNDEFVLRKLFREIEYARAAQPVGCIVPDSDALESEAVRQTESQTDTPTDNHAEATTTTPAPRLSGTKVKAKDKGAPKAKAKSKTATEANAATRSISRASKPAKGRAAA